MRSFSLSSILLETRTILSSFPNPVNFLSDLENKIKIVASALNDPPADYLERVKNIHSHGGFNSKGYGYDWSKEEAMKNVLRTHTTAVSAKMLYKLAQQKEFKPTKYFRFAQKKIFLRAFNECLVSTECSEMKPWTTPISQSSIKSKASLLITMSRSPT